MKCNKVKWSKHSMSVFYFLIPVLLHGDVLLCKIEPCLTLKKMNCFVHFLHVCFSPIEMCLKSCHAGCILCSVHCAWHRAYMYRGPHQRAPTTWHFHMLSHGCSRMIDRTTEPMKLGVQHQHTEARPPLGCLACEFRRKGKWEVKAVNVRCKVPCQTLLPASITCYMLIVGWKGASHVECSYHNF